VCRGLFSTLNYRGRQAAAKSIDEGDQGEQCLRNVHQECFAANIPNPLPAGSGHPAINTLKPICSLKQQLGDNNSQMDKLLAAYAY